MEDAMLMQLLQEQELIDRKQMGLFGTKTNQQIVGTNQYAMTNNFVKHPKHETKASTDFWKLRNKNKAYHSVVGSPQEGVGSQFNLNAA